MNILITGCTGFIGFHLSKSLLKENINVIGVDNFGLSAPGTDVAQHFNFTKENIKNKIEEYLSE